MTGATGARPAPCGMGITALTVAWSGERKPDMSAPIAELMLIVFVTFFVTPVAIAAWDEWRWMKYRQHRERAHDLMLTTRKERTYE